MRIEVAVMMQVRVPDNTDRSCKELCVRFCVKKGGTS
jgi:hypothetical protein